MKTVKMITIRLCAGLAVLALVSGCAVTAKRIDTQTLGEIAETGYFTLVSGNETGRYGPVVVLPERHDSRLIQAQDAYLMDILAENSGLARIALEGMFQGETFDGITLPGAGEPERTQALLWLLESGEITAPEFMYLAKNFRVFGTEKPEEYAVDISEMAAYSVYVYLQASVLINSEQKRSDVLSAFERFNTANDDESFQRYFNELLALNPWTKESHETITNGSPDARSKRLRELLNKIEPHRKEFEIPGEAREAFLEYIKFTDTVIQRSATMCRAVEAELRKNNGIMAMVIGADHTDDVEKYFTAAKISYYVFEPNGLETGTHASNLSTEEYSRKQEQRSVLMGAEIFRILEQEKKPRPILGKTWPKNSFSLAALMGIVARASFGTSGPPPYGLSDEALMVGNFRVLAGSITKLDEDTVMFQITNGREDLYVKMARNTGVEAWSSNIRTALKQIIETLSRREYQAISEDAFQVFKFDNYTTVVGTNLEAVHALTITG